VLECHSFTEDPHPQPPRCFLDAPEVDKIVREIQAHHGPRQENELPQLAELGIGNQLLGSAEPDAAAPTGPCAAPGASAEPKPDKLWPPKRIDHSRSCVATVQCSAEFGKMVAAEGYRRNFHGAKRGAFLGDGSAWIWKLFEAWFPGLTAIVDFVHVLTYLYVTATVLASSVTERWQLYVGWMTLCWQGRVREVIEQMEAWLARVEPFSGTGKPSPTHPHEVLRRTLTYLKNNEPRMNYAEYRKQGLPVTSSMIESLIKEINYRVKGTEKFWDNPEGAEAILQVRAAQLSDDDRLANHIASRAGSPLRRYTKRGSAQFAQTI
jgi:hypothetical protein